MRGGSELMKAIARPGVVWALVAVLVMPAVGHAQTFPYIVDDGTTVISGNYPILQPALPRSVPKT